MRFFWPIIGLALAVGAGAWADTLILSDGTSLLGELTGVGIERVYFRTWQGQELTLAWERVGQLVIDWEENPEPRLDYEEWLSAIEPVRKELYQCRRSKQGITLGGLLFIAGGWWLITQGHDLFGQLLVGWGAVATLLGIAAPKPACPTLLHRAALLTQIGLAHGWFY